MKVLHYIMNGIHHLYLFIRKLSVWMAAYVYLGIIGSQEKGIEGNVIGEYLHILEW